MFEKLVHEQKRYFRSGRTSSIDFRIKQLHGLKQLVQNYEGRIIEAVKSDIGRPETEIYTSEIYTVVSELKLMIGNLKKWADQGVLLLNATLTVRAASPGSHQNKGWETFTDAAISALSEKRSGLVFMLWGSYAQAKQGLIDNSRHHILKAPHPSPFSVRRGFFGCRHFSAANSILRDQGKEEIDWAIE